MRAGTSKGVFLLLEDVPEDRGERRALLERLLGTDVSQMDGLGGGHALSSKVALVSRSEEPGIDIDYRFVQVVPGRSVNDTVSCGNLMSAVGPFAIERGLVAASDPETVVAVRDINNGAQAELTVRTPGGRVSYAGDVGLPGIPGTSAPIWVTYTELISDPGSLFPSGNRADTVSGHDFTYIKAAVPLLILRGSDFGVDFSVRSLRYMSERDLIERILDVRDEAVAHVGETVDRSSTAPKVALVGEPCEGGNLAVRYFTPHTAHRSAAVTGAISLAIASDLPGTVAAEHAREGDHEGHLKGTVEINLEHLAGTMTLKVSFQDIDGVRYPESVALLRTARLLMRGIAYLP